MHAEFRDRNSIGQITLSENITGAPSLPLEFPGQSGDTRIRKQEPECQGRGAAVKLIFVVSLIERSLYEPIKRKSTGCSHNPE
jgi:hypothetical protein